MEGEKLGAGQSSHVIMQGMHHTTEKIIHNSNLNNTQDKI